MKQTQFQISSKRISSRLPVWAPSNPHDGWQLARIQYFSCRQSIFRAACILPHCKMQRVLTCGDGTSNDVITSQPKRPSFTRVWGLLVFYFHLLLNGYSYCIGAPKSPAHTAWKGNVPTHIHRQYPTFLDVRLFSWLPLESVSSVSWDNIDGLVRVLMFVVNASSPTSTVDPIAPFSVFGPSFDSTSNSNCDDLISRD